jgi:hypothetical protein
MQILCELCKKPLRTDEVAVHQWTAGWVKQRSGGGGHGISLAERSPRWAHGYCVDRASAGYDERQQGMFK